MTAALTLAGPEHLEKLTGLVEAFHSESGLDTPHMARDAALTSLLDGIPHGSAYLIGPARAPIGYIIISFGWSIEFGGLDAFIDEFYIRPNVRGRGMASEVLLTLPNALAQHAGLKAIHLEVDILNDAAERLYERAGFRRREQYNLMTRVF